MRRGARLGMITPSSNTVLEPLTAAMTAGIPDLSTHFSRFAVTEISLSEHGVRQFNYDDMLRAAELLAHAKVDTIAWNGTSANWLGFDRDEHLCELITRETGIVSTTTALAYRELLLSKPHTVGLLTPYRADVQQRILQNWAAAGFPCVAERHLDLQDNFSFAEIDKDRISSIARELVSAGCDSIAILCTNMRGAPIATALEAELSCTIYDSVAVTLWKSLLLAGIDPARVTNWGRLFQTK
ncbi:MAG TPA: aspartate/glutamate racemase family protein [Nitrobacter sp.]|nr:aspartate/glutamate racemase family protein [Nitrobacter sp.]